MQALTRVVPTERRHMCAQIMPLPSASPRNPLRWLLGLALQVEVAADVASQGRALLEEVLGLPPVE